MLSQIIAAFIAMSAKGVMHRDLKPENILLTKNNTIKIADFGCAKLVDINNLSMMDSRSMEKGTYLYVSPQQLKLEKYSFKCDVWAAGCIAYLLEYGYHPFIEANPHNVLQEIEKKALVHPIETIEGTDPSIAAFIHLTLVYEDIERASWRELRLCRIFAPKIKSVEKYISYLRNLSPLANQIVKEFWKIHKTFNFPNSSDEILIYYLIKFQMNNLKMCLRLFKKMESYSYLFDPATYAAYEPKEDTFNEVKKSYLEYEKYFTSIKKTMEGKECYTKIIYPNEPKRVSSFVDLDKSIRTGYKILAWVKKELKGHPSGQSRVWVLIARWINFEEWFSFEKEPSLEKILGESVGDVQGQIEE
jgi:serine/threonine protein kinase